MSDTPRTDEIEGLTFTGATTFGACLDLARQLERELAQEKADATRWRKHCEIMRRGDVSLLVRVLFDLTPEQYATTIDAISASEYQTKTINPATP